MSFIRRNRRTRRALVSTSKAQITPAMEQFKPLLIELAKEPLTLVQSVVRDDNGRPTGQFEWQDTIVVAPEDKDNAQALRGYGKSLKSMARHEGILVATSDGYDTADGRAMDVSVRRLYTAEELALSPRPKASELLSKGPSAKDVLDAALTEYLAIDAVDSDTTPMEEAIEAAEAAIDSEGNDESEDSAS